MKNLLRKANISAMAFQDRKVVSRIWCCFVVCFAL